MKKKEDERERKKRRHQTCEPCGSLLAQGGGQMEAWRRIQMSRCQWVRRQSALNPSHITTYSPACALLMKWTDEICVMWCYIFKATLGTFLCLQLQHREGNALAFTNFTILIYCNKVNCTQYIYLYQITQPDRCMPIDNRMHCCA